MSLERYSPCHRCNTMRPRSRLLAGACADGFCARVFVVTDAALAHRAWWLGRYPFTAYLAEDIHQEASLAAWRAADVFDWNRGIRFSTFAWYRMRTAVRQLLRRQHFGQPRRVGDVYEQWDLADDAPATDYPTLLRQCAQDMASPYAARGANATAATMLVLMELGENQSDAARAAGVSRQYASQVRQRLAPESRRRTTLACHRSP